MTWMARWWAGFVVAGLVVIDPGPVCSAGLTFNLTLSAPVVLGEVGKRDKVLPMSLSRSAIVGVSSWSPLCFTPPLLLRPPPLHAVPSPAMGDSSPMVLVATVLGQPSLSSVLLLLLGLAPLG